MIARYQLLARRIQVELEELERTQAAIHRHWQTARSVAADQDAYLNSVALNVHSFCSALQPDTAVRLDEYRKFRHRIRNIYATNLDPDRMAPLVMGLATLWPAIRQ